MIFWKSVNHQRIRWAGWGVGVFLLMMGVLSCRRQQMRGLTESEDSGSGVKLSRELERGKRTGTESELMARVAELHDAERQWIRENPEAAEALRGLEKARTVYATALESFGPYAAAKRDRDQAVQRLVDVRDRGQDEVRPTAEADVLEAEKKLKEIEEWLRLGNPRIRRAYEEWESARLRYSALKAGQSNLVMKIAAVREKTAASETGSNTTTEGGKEN